MESPETTLEVKFVARVVKITEHKYNQWIKGVGNEAVFQVISLGWFVTLEGSHESIFVGWFKPRIRFGSMATITIEYPIDA